MDNFKFYGIASWEKVTRRKRVFSPSLTSLSYFKCYHTPAYAKTQRNHVLFVPLPIDLDIWMEHLMENKD